MVSIFLKVTGVIVLCAFVASVSLCITDNDQQMPGADVSFDNLPAIDTRSMVEPSLHISYSFHDTKLYEGIEFKVTITDLLSRPVEGANVSFMKPAIYGLTDQDGLVSFSAPYISKASAPHYIHTEYINSPEDTSCTFPLIVKKKGYNDNIKNIRVQIRGEKNVDMP